MEHSKGNGTRRVRGRWKIKKEKTPVSLISRMYSVLADLFMLYPMGNSDSQVRALVDNVEEKMHKAGVTQKQGEGRNGGSWVLLVLRRYYRPCI